MILYCASLNELILFEVESATFSNDVFEMGFYFRTEHDSTIMPEIVLRYDFELVGCL